MSARDRRALVDRNHYDLSVRRQFQLLGTPVLHDPKMCKRRHLIENFFQRLKELRRLAARSDKAGTSFSTTFYLGATLLALQ